MDALTDIIRLLRPKTVLLGAMAASGRWGVRVPPQPGPTFYFVMEGKCWFRGEDGEAVELREGDYILSARPTVDTFFSAPGVRIELSDETFKARHLVDGEIRIGDGGEGPATRVLGGLILCDPANSDLLFGLMPRCMRVSAADASAGRLHALVTIVREESASAHPGRDAILSRIIEVMLIETLRLDAATRQAHPGVLRGLADPKLAPALADIHADAARTWTIADLARRAGMSRSVFARRFSEVVGAAPVEYLLRWRMALAKDALRHGGGTLDEIAEKIGYKSASAFSTAFRQRIGCPPSDYASRLELQV